MTTQKIPINHEDIIWEKNERGQLVPNVHIYDIVWKESKAHHYMVHAIWASGRIQLKQVGGTDRLNIEPPTTKP